MREYRWKVNILSLIFIVKLLMTAVDYISVICGIVSAYNLRLLLLFSESDMVLHIDYWIPEDPVYMPIHVGREGKADIGYMGDHTGDYISSKNANYC